jgi:hypothetical protein
MMPPLGALATRAAESGEPAPLLLEATAGTIVFLPRPLDEGQAAALAALRSALEI